MHAESSDCAGTCCNFFTSYNTTVKNFIFLCFVVVIASGSCRSVLRTRNAMDSTATRSQESAEKFTREIIREYVPGKTDTVIQHSVSTVEVPKYLTVPGPTIYRETIRETGERQQTQLDQASVQTETKEVKKEPMPWWAFMAIGAGIVLTLVFIAGFIYLVVKVRGLVALK